MQRLSIPGVFPECHKDALFTGVRRGDFDIIPLLSLMRANSFGVLSEPSGLERDWGKLDSRHLLPNLCRRGLILCGQKMLELRGNLIVLLGSQGGNSLHFSSFIGIGEIPIKLTVQIYCIPNHL